MRLIMNIAGSTIAITFSGQTKKAVPLFHQFFRDFLHPGQMGDAEIKVSILKNINNHPPIGENIRNPVLEERLPIPDVVAWLNKAPGYEDDFPINETTISSICLGGLLLFNPDTVAGRIYLLRPGPECFLPLYRLFWMYFAQVLGERESCFVHSAALVKDKRGYLFLGDSGAGKSSLAGICGKSVVLSDDSPIFCKRNFDYLVFPSPFHQLDSLKGLKTEDVGRGARVAGLYFLIKDNQAYLENVSKREAVSLIINRYILFSPYLSTRAKLALFDLFIEACDKIPYHNLHFCLDKDVWSVIADG